MCGQHKVNTNGELTVSAFQLFKVKLEAGKGLSKVRRQKEIDRWFHSLLRIFYVSSPHSLTFQQFFLKNPKVFDFTVMLRMNIIRKLITLGAVHK